MPKSKNNAKKSSVSNVPLDPSSFNFSFFGPIGFPDHWVEKCGETEFPWVIELLTHAGIGRNHKRSIPKASPHAMDALIWVHPSVRKCSDIDKNMICFLLMNPHTRGNILSLNCMTDYILDSEFDDPTERLVPEIEVFREWNISLRDVPPKSFSEDKNPFAEYLRSVSKDDHEGGSKALESAPEEIRTLIDPKNIRKLDEVFYELWSELDEFLSKDEFYEESQEDEIDSDRTETQRLVVDRLYSLAIAIGGMSCLSIFFKMYPKLGMFFKDMLRVSDYLDVKGKTEHSLRKVHLFTDLAFKDTTKAITGSELPPVRNHIENNGDPVAKNQNKNSSDNKSPTKPSENDKPVVSTSTAVPAPIATLGTDISQACKPEDLVAWESNVQRLRVLSSSIEHTFTLQHLDEIQLIAGELEQLKSRLESTGDMLALEIIKRIESLLALLAFASQQSGADTFGWLSDSTLLECIRYEWVSRLKQATSEASLAEVSQHLLCTSETVAAVTMVARNTLAAMADKDNELAGIAALQSQAKTLKERSSLLQQRSALMHQQAALQQQMVELESNLSGLFETAEGLSLRQKPDIAVKHKLAKGQDVVTDVVAKLLDASAPKMGEVTGLAIDRFYTAQVASGPNLPMYSALKVSRGDFLIKGKSGDLVIDHAGVDAHRLNLQSHEASSDAQLLFSVETLLEAHAANRPKTALPELLALPETDQPTTIPTHEPKAEPTVQSEVPAAPAQTPPKVIPAKVVPVASVTPVTAAPQNKSAQPTPQKSKVEPAAPEKPTPQVAVVNTPAIQPTPAPEPVPEATPAPAPALTAVQAPAPEKRTVPAGEMTIGEVAYWSALASGHRATAYALSDAMDACVAQGDSAYTITTEQLPDTQISRLLMLSPYLTGQLSPLAEAMSEGFAGISRSNGRVLESVNQKLEDAYSLLAAATLLRPLLLAPGTGAPAVANLLSLSKDSECAYKLVKACMAHGETLQPYQISAAMFKSTQSQADWEATVQGIYKEALAWREVAHDANLQYVPATRVWLHWFKAGGLIQTTLDAMKSADTDTIRQRVAVFSDAIALEKAVNYTDRNELDRRVGENILRRSITLMQSKTSELVNLCRKWLLAMESRPSNSEVFIRVLMNARNELWSLCEEVNVRFSGLITDFQTGKQSRETSYALECAKQVFLDEVRQFQNLFRQDTQNADLVEPTQKTILQSESCYLLGVDALEDSEPTSVVLSALQACTAGFSPSALFDTALGLGMLNKASELLNQMPAGEQDAARSKFTSTEASLRLRLKRQLDTVRASVEAGLTYGYITEAERSQADGTLTRLEATQSVLLDFFKANNSLAEISDMVNNSLEGRKASLRKRIASLPKQADPTSVQRISKSVEEGDILTANEWLQQVESGGVIPDEIMKSGQAFARFFPATLQKLEKELTTETRSDLRSAVTQRRRVLGLPFDELSPAQAKEASITLNTWLDTFVRRRIEKEPMRRLMQMLGFDVINVDPAQESTSFRAECTAFTTPIRNRDICPIPYFGSAAKGIYRIICLWPRAGEEDVIKHIGDSSISRSTIVFYFGTLTERRRRELAKACRTAHKSFLVVDEPLALHLIASGQTAENFFATTTAFTNVAPYDATSSVVPVEMFFGRTKELSAVMSNSGQCFIFGGRQLGKTALMLKAENDFHAPNESRYSTWIDLRSEGIGVGRSPVDIWNVIYKSLIRRGLFQEGAIEEPSASARSRIDGFIEYLHQRLQDNKQLRILLLLDEADKFFEADAEEDFTQTRRLKQLMEGTERRFKPVFAGLHNVLRMTTRANHPLAHLGEPIKIGPLLHASELRDAYDLITKPFEAAGYVFESPALVTRVLAQTNYYPSLCQLYCAHLMRYMANTFQSDPRMMHQGPLYKITAEHVDAVYLSRELRTEIREKFHLTLQLDDRYEVIAYAMALASFEDNANVVTDGLSDAQIRTMASDWWKDGFVGTSNNEFRVLLEEMDGLGVLRQLDTGKFVLRNPNIVLLLGKQEEIENNLLKDRQVTLELDRSLFRARPSGDLSSVARSPFTMGQSNHLIRSVNDVSVVFGNAMLGIQHASNYIQQFVAKGFFVGLEEGATLAQFRFALENLRTRKPNGTTVLLVPHTAAWTSEWVMEAKDRIKGLRTKAKEVHIIFIADPDTGWRFIRDIPVDKGSMDLPVDTLVLQPWNDAFLAQWMAECGLVNDLSMRQEVRSAMGIWANHLCWSAGKKATKPTDIKASWQHFGRLLGTNDTEQASMLFSTHFGIADKVLEQVLVTLANLDQVTTTEDLAEMAEISTEMAVKAVRWATLLHLVKPITSDSVVIDPTIKRLMDTMAKETQAVA